jgi:hypothetical protein
MKYLTIFFFTLASCATLPKGAPKNDNIIQYIDEVIGEKIGKGMCFDFVESAMRIKMDKWYKKGWEKRSRFKVNSPSPEDVVCFKNHIGIVYSVTDSSIFIAEQNVCDSDDRKKIWYNTGIQYIAGIAIPIYEKVSVCQNSMVQIRELSIEKIKQLKCKFYRF